MPVLELPQVSLQILLRNGDVSPADPALHVRPERFNGVGVNVAANIFFHAVVNGRMPVAVALD